MDKCLAKLAARESKYKYSVTCILMQKNGAGLVTSSSQYWEKQEADLYVPVPWENNSIHCIVTIFVSCFKRQGVASCLFKTFRRLLLFDGMLTTFLFSFHLFDTTPIIVRIILTGHESVPE
jgi:hypothetical protein